MEKSFRVVLPDGREVREARLRQRRGEEIVNVRFPLLPDAPEAEELCRSAARLAAEYAIRRNESAVLKFSAGRKDGRLFIELSGFCGKLSKCRPEKLWILEFDDGKFVWARRVCPRAIDKKRRV